VDPLKKEFVDLLKAVGWTQAEAARQLAMTSGAVNQIVNPNSPVRPSGTTLRLFKLMVASARPEAINSRTLELKETAPPPPTEGERKLVQALRAMNPADLPMVYAIFHAIVASFNARAEINAAARKTRATR